MTVGLMCTELAIGAETTLLSSDELDRLLEALAELDTAAAASVADDIAALRLAGGCIRLNPTEDELAVLRIALADLAVEPVDAR
jgi:hypothetical protein